MYSQGNIKQKNSISDMTFDFLGFYSFRGSPGRGHFGGGSLWNSVLTWGVINVLLFLKIIPPAYAT